LPRKNKRGRSVETDNAITKISEGKMTIIDICKNAGGVAYVAKELGLSRQSIYQWTEVPADHLVNLERITGVDRSLIRPDLFKGEAR